MIEMSELEKYRVDNHLSKAEMSRIFKVVPQAYNNWVYRNSLPKEHIALATKLLGIWKKDYKINSLEDLHLAKNPANKPNMEGVRSDIFELKNNFITEKEVKELAKSYTHIPLISWQQASELSVASTILDIGQPEDWVPSPFPNHSPTTYALKIKNDSMISNAPGERSFFIGDIIYVDPEREHKTGERVIARLPNSSEATFKIYAEDAGVAYFLSINNRYPTFIIPEGTIICGVVIGSFSTE